MDGYIHGVIWLIDPIPRPYNAFLQGSILIMPHSFKLCVNILDRDLLVKSSSEGNSNRLMSQSYSLLQTLNE